MTHARLTAFGFGASLLFASGALAASNPPSLNTPSAKAVAAAPVADGTLGAAIMSAAINPDGTIARGEGVTASGTSKLSTGTYEVGFVRDVTKCAFSVTVGEADIGGAAPAVTGVTLRSGNPSGIFVRVVNSPDKAAEDHPFFVLVYCGR